MVYNNTMKSLAERKEKTQKIIADLKKLFPKTQIALNYSTPWELLVAVVLSAQCRDVMVNKTTDKLFKKYKNLDAYVKADPKEFEQDLKSIIFYRNKSKNILASAKIIRETYNGKIPNTMKELLTLPGVARKTANVLLGNIHHIYEGIVVDTHVKRLSNLMGLTESEDPVKIEQDLLAVIPEKERMDFSYRLIDYGRKYCPARPHNHEACPLKKYYV